MLTETDRQRIAEAVRQAEATTSGEIVCVIAREVSAYPEVPLAIGAVVALALPPLALALGLDPLTLTRWAGGWTAAHGGALRSGLAMALGVYAAVQAALFLATAALSSIPAVRRALTPRALKRRRVERAALAQLAAAALAAGASRAACVIFVSQDDRMVEVVATEALHDAAGQAVWDEAVALVLAGVKRGALADGLVAAVARCQAPLVLHFPGAADDANAIANAPLEL